ncbi:MAG: hypothetical protein ACYTAO_20490 [Planctomycetota bacterium]|jgi:hypothetical protein
MGPFTIRRDEHRIIETDFVRHLRRTLRDDSLFTALNVQTGQWFLAYWINKDRGLANDVDDLGPNMEFATRKLVNQLECSRAGVTAEDIKKRFERAVRTGWQIETEEAQERREVQDWVQKKSGSPIPILTS